FIKGFSKVAFPLHSLTGNAPWEWTDECQQAFDTLKRHITDTPVLAMPTDNDPFHIEADASQYAVGATLSQRQDGKWRTVAFMSKALTPTQRNYEIYDCELLAIMLALEEFRRYLISATELFEIWSDHMNLQYFKQPQKLNCR